MKKIIKVAHLYYDLMNLYGENGNIFALKEFITRQGVDVEVDNVSIPDKIDFKKYDIFYLGTGSEESERLVLEDMFKYKDDIKDAIEDGKTFIVTGNAMELFGTKIRVREDKPLECLGIFDYNAVEASGRIVSELFYEFSELPEGQGRDIVGFKNCKSNIVNNSGEKIFKFSDNIRYKNFYGMMFFGPVLIRNPYFTDYILERLFKEKGYKYKKEDTSIEYKAYHEYVKNFITKENLD